MAAPTGEAPRSVKVGLDTGLKRDVSKIGLLFTGVGAIIGSGWLFGALYASQIAGPASIVSWIIGAVVVMLIALVYSELGAMFPVAGGLVRFPQYAFGSFAGFSVSWLTWLASATVAPVEVLATTQYADPYIPWLMKVAEGVPVLTGPGIVVSVVLMFLFSLINVMGVKLFAQFNNVLVWWKLAVIALVVVMFFALEFNPSNFTSHGFAPNGWGAVFTAVPAAGIGFAYLGFRNAIDYAAETKNPQRNVPFSVIFSVILTAIIYIALQIAFITALPEDLLSKGWASLAFAESAGPLAGISLVLGATWLAILLRVDAVISPADTGLIYSGVAPRLAYASSRNGTTPAWLEKLNSRGVPWAAVILSFVVGCIFFLPFPGWQEFIGFVTAAFAVSFAPGSVVVGALRRQLPDQERPFRLPGGDLIPVLGLIGSSLMVFWNEWAINEKMMVAFLVGYVVYALIHATSKRAMPPLDIKHGLWFPVWVLGLMVVSYFGDLDPTAPAEEAWLLPAGGDGPIGLGLGAVVLTVWSVVIYYAAIASRLSPEKAAAYIQRVPGDEVPAEHSEARS